MLELNEKIDLETLRQRLKEKVQQLQAKAEGFRLYDLGSVLLNGLTPKKGYQIQTDIEYGVQARQKLDLYVSDITSPKPLIVFVHGGAWSHGDKSTYKFVGEAFTRFGYDVAVLNYHLAPEYIFPHYVDDLALALNYLQQQQDDLGISTERIALMGHSAGAFNIASVLYHPQMYDLKNKSNIQAMIGIAGPYHFDYKGDALAQHAFDEEVPYQHVMPYYFVEKNEIQHYLLIAENDQIVANSNSEDFQKQLQHVGNHCEIIMIPKTGHITIMGSVSSLFSRFYETRSEIIRVLDQAFARKNDSI